MLIKQTGQAVDKAPSTASATLRQAQSLVRSVTFLHLGLSLQPAHAGILSALTYYTLFFAILQPQKYSLFERKKRYSAKNKVTDQKNQRRVKNIYPDRIFSDRPEPSYMTAVEKIRENMLLCVQAEIRACQKHKNPRENGKIIRRAEIRVEQPERKQHADLIRFFGDMNFKNTANSDKAQRDVPSKNRKNRADDYPRKRRQTLDIFSEQSVQHHRNSQKM